MDRLNIFKKKPEAPRLSTLPSGSFTVDAHGQILASTLPQSFPEAQLREIGREVLNAFLSGQKAALPFSELIIQYAALKITAREMRGGAIIYLAPKSLTASKTTE